MTAMGHLLVMLTPLAIATALLSGIVFGLVIRTIRPGIDHRLTTFLALLLGVIWYAPQAAQISITWLLDGTAITPWGTLGRWALFTFGFVIPMWLVLRWRKP